MAFKHNLYEEELGKSLTIAAIVLMVNSFGMVVGNLLGGSLFDKLGGYRTIMIVPLHV